MGRRGSGWEDLGSREGVPERVGTDIERSAGNAVHGNWGKEGGILMRGF